MPADLPLEEYALIGNSRTAALVSRNGAIDWYCWPRFDSPALLCRLLDAERGGFLRVAPSAPFEARRRYLPGTNLLELCFETATGKLRTHWFMPVTGAEDAVEGHAAHWILHQVECVSGHVEVEVRFKPTFDYARAPTEVNAVKGGAIATAEGTTLSLVCDADFRSAGPGELAGTIRLRAGQSTWVVLSAGSKELSPGPLAVSHDHLHRALAETKAVWTSWVEGITYDGLYRDLVLRSGLVLKLLTHAPTGAVVAAPTTSLPEEFGGVRNWDYRFAWLRDSAWAVYALQRLGHHDEAMALWRWMERLPWTDGDVQIMYAVDGAPRLRERTLDHLSGYRGSRPVRVGNDAFGQQQFDVYGEVLDSAEYCQREMGGMDDEPFWRLVSNLANRAAEIWRGRDHGIWELRAKAQHFVHSKVMCWVALDRAAKLARRLGHPAESARWAREAAEVRGDVLSHGLDPVRGAFTQSYGSRQLDASVLQLPTFGFLPATDPRMRSTLQRIEDELSEGGLVRRYGIEDGLPGREGAFFLCTFWMVNALSAQGRVAEARELFERTVRHANDLGLMSEQVEPATGELVGNFPQAFSHLGLIRCAVLLSEAVERGEGRPSPGNSNR